MPAQQVNTCIAGIRIEPDSVADLRIFAEYPLWLKFKFALWRETNMDYAYITNEYYSKWLGVSPETRNRNGVVFIASPERDKLQAGYSHMFKIYAFINPHQIILSYSTEVSDRINKMKNKIKLGMTVDEVAAIFKNSVNISVDYSVKFCFNEVPSDIDTSNVIQLNSGHYGQYLEFFKTQNKNTKTEGWLKEYFDDICRNGYAFGYVKNGKLVSASDAPYMPYLQDKVQEIGINTLAEYRQKGYAKSVALSCIKAILDKGKCPQWSCAAENTSSGILASRVGFRKLADVLTISV